MVGKGKRNRRGSGAKALESPGKKVAFPCSNAKALTLHDSNTESINELFAHFADNTRERLETRTRGAK